MTNWTLYCLQMNFVLFALVITNLLIKIEDIYKIRQTMLTSKN